MRNNVSNFIQRATAIHEGKYDYSNAEYITIRTDVIIKCIKHDTVFKQKPITHLRGRTGCVKCIKDKTTTSITDFITNANIIHHNKYDYSDVEYVNSKCKVAIRCNTHGRFNQTPEKHILSGTGCPKCAREYVAKLLSLSKCEFIQRATIIHEGKYDYSNVDYTNSNHKISILCPDHGAFHQQPHDHLQGYGCGECGIAKRHLTTEEFIQRAAVIHEGKYDYSNVTYTSTYDTVSISCPNHGLFYQKPATHLRGSGCKLCTQTGTYNLDSLLGEAGRQKGYVYLNEMSYKQEIFFKIGITTNPTRRFNNLHNKYSIKNVLCVETTLLNAYNIEQLVLTQYRRYSPQLKFNGHTECIVLNDINIDAITKTIATNIG